VQYSLAVAALLLSCAATRVAAQSSFSLQLSTDRGCREDGDDPVYGVGELIAVTFRVDSATRTNAVARVFDVLADGRVGVISFGAIPTNQTRTFSARIGPPTGVEELILQAETASGDDQTRRSCSFRVVATVPGSTATRTPTRTPIPAGTMIATPTPGGPTPVPGGALHPHIRTDRGCIESGDQAHFNIGDPIAVTFRIDSFTIAQAQAAIRDIFPNGVVKIFSFGRCRPMRGSR
jgi:hypothetical protein